MFLTGYCNGARASAGLCRTHVSGTKPVARSRRTDSQLLSLFSLSAPLPNVRRSVICPTRAKEDSGISLTEKNHRLNWACHVCDAPRSLAPSQRHSPPPQDLPHPTTCCSTGELLCVASSYLEIYYSYWTYITHVNMPFWGYLLFVTGKPLCLMLSHCYNFFFEAAMGYDNGIYFVQTLP